MSKFLVGIFFLTSSLTAFSQEVNNHLVILINEGKTAELKGNLLAAEDAYMSALTIDSNSVSVHVLLGKLYYELDKFNLALAEFNRALFLDPYNSEVYFNRANLYVDLNNNNIAISDYSNSILLDPSNMQAYMARGFVYAQQEKYEQAIKDFSVAIELNHDEAVAYYNFMRVQGVEPLQKNCIFAEQKVKAGDMQASLVFNTFCF